MTEPIEVHTCEDCGQPLYKVCPSCDGEGDYLGYADDSFGCPQLRYDCEECDGTGWKSIDCACTSFDRTGHISAQFPDLEGKV